MQIVESGCVGVSFASVAKSAGVSRGGVLHHFPSSADLLGNVMAHAARRLADRLDHLAARSVNLSTRECIDAALSVWWSAPAVALCEIGLHCRGMRSLAPRWSDSAGTVDAAWERVRGRLHSEEHALSLECARHAAQWAVMTRQHRAPSESLRRVIAHLQAGAVAPRHESSGFPSCPGASFPTA